MSGTHPISPVSPQQLVGPHLDLPLGLWILQYQGIIFSLQPVAAGQPTTIGRVSTLNAHPELIHYREKIGRVFSD